MGPFLTLDFERVQVIHAERARYLLGLYSKEECDAKFAGVSAPPNKHTHPQSDIQNLASDLAGKAALIHQHPASDITSGTMSGRLVVETNNSTSGQFAIIAQADGDGGYGTHGAVMWRDESGNKMGMLTDTANVSGDWGMFMLFGRSDSAFQRVGEWDIAARNLGGEARVSGFTCDFNPSADGGFGLHAFTRDGGGSLNYGLWVDGNLGVCVGSFANGYTPPSGGLIVPGFVGVGGVDVPSESLTVGESAYVVGDLFVDGKIYAGGGVDPPYVLCDEISRADLVARVSSEVPAGKRGGAALFFNKDSKRLEVYSPRDGTFYDLFGVPLGGVPQMPAAPVTAETRYAFDGRTARVVAVEIAKPSKRKLKPGYHIEPLTGNFYRVEMSEPNELTGLRSKRTVPATAAEAIADI